MPLDLNRTRQHLKKFDFRALFIEEMGWDRLAQTLDVLVEENRFQLHAVAQKRGLVAFVCNPLADGRIPDYATRRKIETQVAKSVHEHIIVYVDRNNTAQVWQWVRREPGSPSACRERAYHAGQSGDPLIQRLQAIAFSLEEEESLTIIDVTGRVRAAFDVERITKRFYDRFKTEHAAFLKFIKGIPDEEMKRWYASVMINRLMFIYFIQRKGFLDNHTDYLRSKLAETKRRGKNLFYSEFLCVLFFKGFAEKDRSAETKHLLGDVPYLNGGLFLRHQIEEIHGKKIDLADAAFEKLFDFFDAYQWNLDERPLRDDREINPDVLGYIFEKYINQKQMGAYYTKEDITEYISKNTIVPFLLDKTRQKCKIAFEGDASVWRLLQVDPDRYFYDAVKRGVELALPLEIASGLNDVSKRSEWNKPALAEYALPTETWREVVARRERYKEVRQRLAAGAVRDIDDLITYNLDTRQFAQDVITNSEGPDLLRAFWHAIVGRIPERTNERFENGISILDPTCGSGAFLFAALNILEPLYDACLDRMQVFLDDLERSGEKRDPRQFGDFRKLLERVEKHRNHRYFVLKSIIINNLFGVDIMEEAVEICKLRLFLKLVAQIERGEPIEPLPDIDFNIRAGNTLVGYGTYSDVKEAVTSKLDFENSMARIEAKAEDIDRLSILFRQQQTELNGEVTAADKEELRNRLTALEDELNVYLAGEYAIDPNKKTRFESWLQSHKPFHWFIEFHSIMSGGGFDVVIGNPPYVELKELREYRPIKYACEHAGNTYALVMERCLALRCDRGREGFIVPVSSVSTDRYLSLQQLLAKNVLHYSSFDDRPSRLFEGLEHIRLTIHLIGKLSGAPSLFSTRYNKWASTQRPHLFQTLRYAVASSVSLNGTMPKLSSELETDIFSKLEADKSRLSVFYARGGTHRVFYSRKVGYFLQVLNFEPLVLDGSGNRRPPSEFKELCFGSEHHADLALCCLNSNLFYWFVTVVSDCRHVNKREVDAFPVNLERLASDDQSAHLRGLGQHLMSDLKDNSEQRKMRFQHDSLTVQCIFPKKSKPIIDDIDRLLARHFGFTDEELDFIINYDIKYRMGRDSNVDDE